MITVHRFRAGLLLGALACLSSQGGLALAASPPEPAPRAPATAAPPETTLAQAIALAWQRATQAAQARGQAAQAQASRLGAQSWLAGPPALELGARTDRWHQNQGAQEQELAVALPLWLPGQRDARQHASEAERAQAELDARLARWQLGGEVIQAAWAVQGLQQERAAQAAALAELQALEADVARRVTAGELARADALAVQGEVLAATQQWLGVQGRLREAQAGWQALTGLAQVPALAMPTAVPPAGRQPALAPNVNAADTPVDTLAEGAPHAGHPELQAARQRVALAEAHLDTARRDTREAPELTVGLRRERGARGEAVAHSLGLAVRWAWGSEARQQPLLQAALAELDEARTALDLVQARAQTQAELAATQVQDEQARLLAAQGRARVLAQRAELIDRAFRAGDMPLPELLRARHDQRLAQAELAAQEAATGLALARHQHLQGSQP